MNIIMKMIFRQASEIVNFAGAEFVSNVRHNESGYRHSEK